MFKNKTIVLVCDRAYHSMELFNFCENNNIKFVIRVKDNSNIFNDNKTTDKDVLHYRNSKNIRKITNVYITDDIIEIADNTIINVKIPIECNIISNLDNIFTDNVIGNIYAARWNTEIFLKIQKTQQRYHCQDQKMMSPLKNKNILIL